MTNFGLIPLEHCKTLLEMDDIDKELTELPIFFASAEIESYNNETYVAAYSNSTKISRKFSCIV